MSAWSRRREGPVGILTLTRPPINALDQTALDELAEAVEWADRDPAVESVVVTGGLAGLFCSGGDLKYWRDRRDARAVSAAGRQVFAGLERLPKPTVAAVNGQVIGDGLGLVLGCDLRIAADAATVRLPELRYGFIPGWGLIHRLVAVVGQARASELLLTGEPIPAARAQAMGLVGEVVPGGRLIDEAVARAGRMAAMSPAAFRAARCALRGGDEGACFARVWGGRDWQEGITALLAKRPPVFVRDGGDGDDLAGGVPQDRPASRPGCCR